MLKGLNRRTFLVFKLVKPPSILSALSCNLLILPVLRTTLIFYYGAILEARSELNSPRNYSQTYAPELKLLGAAIGGPVTNVMGLVHQANHGIYAGIAPAGIYGLANAFNTTEVWDFLDTHLVEATASRFRDALTQCAFQNTVEFIFEEDIGAYFTEGLATFDDPIIADLVNFTGIMGTHGTPQMPLYFYSAIGDEVEPS